MSKEQEYLAKLGKAVADWNVYEATIELLVQYLSGGGNRVDILTAYLRNVSLNDALKTLANEFSPDDEKENLLFVSELFDRLREYRNYYVHGIRYLVGVPGTDEVEGYSQSVTAKSRLRLHQASVTGRELDDFIRNLHDAKRYTDFVLFNLSALSRDPEIEQPSPPPEKPPLPDRLKRPSLFLLDALR